MEEVWSTIHNAECYLTADLRPRNKDKRRTRMSQSCEMAMLTRSNLIP